MRTIVTFLMAWEKDPSPLIAMMAESQGDRRGQFAPKEADQLAGLARVA
jgi:hypothetical protein